MAELTIQVSDEMARQLEPLQERIPELLKRLIETVSPDRPKAEGPFSNENITKSAAPPAYSEVIDFLITRPTLEEIAGFKVSEEAQYRIRVLLERNREGTLNEKDEAELDLYEHLDHLMILLKAKACSAAVK